MGIRIHKILGYGMQGMDRKKLNDILYETSKPNEVARLLRKKYKSMSNDNDIEKLLFRYELPDRNKNYPKRFADIVHYAEYPDDDNGYHVIIPPSQVATWYRFDNVMDYYDAGGNDPDWKLETKVQKISSPLYPYYIWMDKNTGKQLNNYLPLRDSNPDAVPMPPLAVIEIAKHLGFDWKLLRPVLITWWS